jgi:hypothetical protein
MVGMVDKKLTLLELNLGDGTVQIGPATLGGSSDDDDDATVDDEDEGDAAEGCGCPGRKLGTLLLVLGGLVLLAVVAKKLRGGDDDLDELEDLADLDEE